MARKRGGIIEAIGCAGVAVALSSVLSVMFNIPFAGIISIIVVYFALCKKRKVSPILFVTGYLILTFVLSISVFGNLFTIMGVML